MTQKQRVKAPEYNLALSMSVAVMKDIRLAIEKQTQDWRTNQSIDRLYGMVDVHRQLTTAIEEFDNVPPLRGE